MVEAPGVVRRIARGSARQPLVDVPDAIPVRVRKDVDELDAVGARVPKTGQSRERLRPAAPGVCVVHGGRCGPHTLPERDAERFPGGWTGGMPWCVAVGRTRCGPERPPGTARRIPAGRRAAGVPAVAGRSGPGRSAPLSVARKLRTAKVSVSSTRLPRPGRPSTRRGTGSTNTTSLGSPAPAGKASRGEERWPERVCRGGRMDRLSVCVCTALSVRIARPSARSGRFRRLGEDVVRLAEVESRPSCWRWVAATPVPGRR